MAGIALSPRLMRVASFIPRGARVADVGTDHARLPLWLVQNGVCERVTATDLSAGPLGRAERLVSKCGLLDRVRLMRADGLAGLEGEIDRAVIAGMGGDVISGILARAPWLREEGVALILQPMTAAEVLRAFLQNSGYAITAESLVKEGRRLYQIIAAAPGQMPEIAPANLHCGVMLSGDAYYPEFLGTLITRFEKALSGARGDPARAGIFREILDGLYAQREKCK